MKNTHIKKILLTIIIIIEIIILIVIGIILYDKYSLDIYKKPPCDYNNALKV